MANENKQDGLFHWNFDLQESDSDFTDIDYSANAINLTPKEEEAEIKPLIFVDGSYKSDASAGQETDSYEKEEEGSFRKYRKEAARKGAFAGRGKKEPDHPDYYEDQERFSGEGRNIPWKPILIGGGILLLALLGLILMLGGRDKREKVWARNEDKTIDQLVRTYFQAKTEANATAMKNVLVEGAEVDSLQMTLDAKAYEAYNDVRVYAYPGMKKTETGLFLTYNSKFKNIDTQLPTIAWFYVKPDKENNLKLMPLTDDSSPEYKYIYSTYAGSPVEKLAGEVSAANKKAIEDDPNLRKYLSQLAAKNYEPFVPETTTTVPPTTTQAPTTQPTTTTAEPVSTAYVPSGPICYITEDQVRMRSSMDTTDLGNVLTAFEAGHALEILEELDGWVRVRDMLSQNKDGGAQTPTGQEGYVYASFISK